MKWKCLLDGSTMLDNLIVERGRGSVMLKIMVLH